MAWLQISLVSDPDDLERVEAALTEAGALAITLMNPEDTPLLIEESPRLRVTGLFDAGLDIETVRSLLMSALKVDSLPVP